MDKKTLEKYLTEKKKATPEDLSNYIMNTTIKAVDDWVRKNIPNYQPYDRGEYTGKLASDMMDFYEGMLKSAKRKRKK